MEKCDGCKWWSDMIAQCIGGGPVEAYCLNPDSSKFGTYTLNGCVKKEDGLAIDSLNKKGPRK
jgi:hypothetical protein